MSREIGTAPRPADGTSAGRRGPVREWLDYFLWFYTPLKPMTAAGIYDLVSTNAFSAEGLYLNLGYWEKAETIDEACEAMAMLVAETAGMTRGDDVVDVGFGFADQDMLWSERCAPRRITGLNITPSQVRVAQERVAARGLTDRITLLEGSATEMRLPDAAFDRVVGVECAFHFDTRERFFEEAFRVLRPGGRLALADVIRNDPRPGAWGRRVQDFNWTFFAKKYAVPEANWDTRASYAAKLDAAGFGEVSVRSIRARVYPGLHRFMARDPDMLKRFHPLARLPYRLSLRFDADKVYGAYDYVLVSAEKPS